MQRIPQRYPNAYLPPFHSKDSEPSQTTCPPMDAFHASKAESTRLADEFPFSYSIAKEMPHIFGNMEDDEVLDHPLTPSFECSSDLAPSREIVTHESCQFGLTTTDFSDCVLPEQSEISRNRPHSCCFGGNSVQSHPLIKEPSYGLMSEGRSLRFYRHDWASWKDIISLEVVAIFDFEAIFYYERLFVLALHRQISYFEVFPFICHQGMQRFLVIC